jgi:predicted RNase H-like HicB family nuclease
MTRTYVVVFEKGARNWSAYVPDLPGVIATARTRKEIEAMIREAAEFHIEGLKLEGYEVPPATTEAGTLRISA